MINNNERNILEMQEQLAQLSQLITDDWQDLDLHTTEERIFRYLMKIGNTALKTFVEKKGTGNNAFGENIAGHTIKKCNYMSVFGTIKIRKTYFWKQGLKKGVFPIEKEFNLPEKQYSYLLQNWNQLLAVDSNYDASRKTLEKILGINIWTKQSEEINQNAAVHVDDFYKTHPEKKQNQPILVAQVDGKGIVMRKDQTERKRPGPRLKRGEKNGKKKMAIVTAVYGVDRNKRTDKDIIRYEIDHSTNNPQKPILKVEKDSGPKPQNKIVRSTLGGKDKAFQRIIEDVENRDPNNNCEHILLMDGERALEKKANEYLTPKGFIFILDLFHVMERLWKLCYFFCKEGTIESIIWVKKYLTMILQGKIGYVIGAIRQMVTKRSFSKTQKKNVEKLLRYYEKRKSYMKYNEYLSKGYPIGSGVIEGACRSFVKDRMELAGMRWSEKGAESMLELRSIKVNGKWDEYWNWFILEEKKRLYNRIDSYPREMSNLEKIA